MAEIDFPSNPTEGQTFIPPGLEISYTYDGTKWTVAPSQEGSSTGGGGGGGGGFTNRLRNGAMDVWQRGTSGTVVAGGGSIENHTADGWRLYPQGAAARWARVASNWSTRFALQISGASGMTACYLIQNIESFLAAPLAGKTVTWQCRLRNNSGAPIHPGLATVYTTVADDFSSSNLLDDVPGVYPTTPIANGAEALLAYTFTCSPSAKNGYQVTLGLGPLVAGNVTVSEFDLRVTPELTVNQAPTVVPFPELRDVATELNLCQRYLRRWNATGGTTGGAIDIGAVSSANNEGYTGVQINMRVMPTMTFSGEEHFYAANIGVQSITINEHSNAQYMSLALTLRASGGSIGQPFNFWCKNPGWFQLSAEL